MAHDLFRALEGEFQAIFRIVTQNSAQHINIDRDRNEIKKFVVSYFSNYDGKLGDTSVDTGQLGSDMHALLRLAQGRNTKQKYVSLLKKMRSHLNSLEPHVIASGTSAQGSPNQFDLPVIKTLESLVPDSAKCYRQAMTDLADTNRLSYRGVALELRECLREVLDHLAPDQQVAQSSGFVLEQNQTKPTQKQKVRYILRLRGRSKSEIEAPLDFMSAIEEAFGQATRSVYSKASRSTHSLQPREQVLELKRYMDAVLGTVLELDA